MTAAPTRSRNWPITQTIAESSMTDTPPDDPLIAYLTENPPADVFEFRQILDGFSLETNTDLPEIGASIDDVVIDAYEKQDLTVDIHQPRGEGPFPVLIYLHGGGWVLGSPKTHRRLGFRFAEAGFLVFNVHYRLAPEYPFPAAFEDSVRALDWVIENAPGYGGDIDRLAMGGDSAGGNLTAAVAAHADAASQLRSLLLIYPALDFANMDAADGALPGTDINLTSMMVDSYIGHDQSVLELDSRVSPIHAAEHLTEALITCGTADGLITECRQLEEKLTAHGIPFETDYYEGMPHGFCQMEEMFPQARQSIERMIAFLNRTLS